MTTPTSAGSNAGLSTFHNLRVVELGSWVTAAAASALLADLGAEVIKVEPPSGDPSRRGFAAMGASSDQVPTFRLDNRAKRSVIVDLDSDGGPQRLIELVSTADVFITNVRISSLERLGMDPEAILPLCPRLVYALVTGFGRRGPDRDRPSYDIGAFWARSGLSHQLTPPGAAPLNMLGALGDHVTSLSITAAILAALMERTSSGSGGLVETSLLQTGAWTLGWDLAIQASYGRVNPAAARTDSLAPLMNPYRTADDRWLFLMGLDVKRHFGNLCEAISRPDLGQDERFADARSVRKNSKDLIAILDTAFRERTLAEWAERLDAAGMWWSPCRTPAEVLVDPQLSANDVLSDAADPHQPARLVPSPYTVFGHRPDTSPPPDLGEYDSILVGGHND
jgi:crotonobetainyl-CoA:carnitine CoA-transferase CaiB-like acyl-CoA transferase